MDNDDVPRERWRFRPNPWDLPIALVLLAVVVGLLRCSPDVRTARIAADRAADEANLRQIHAWLLQQRRAGLVPTAGGHRLLLQLWTRGTIEPTAENLTRFFTPGRREMDPRYEDLRARLLRGEAIWTDLELTTSQDTHYAALATPFLGHLFDAGQVIAADDCEEGWPFAPHVVNVLYGDGRVRELQLDELPVFGPHSPTPELRCLER